MTETRTTVRRELPSLEVVEGYPPCNTAYQLGSHQVATYKLPQKGLSLMWTHPPLVFVRGVVVLSGFAGRPFGAMPSVPHGRPGPNPAVASPKR